MQDPIVFSGTVRYNLNPFGGKTADADMWAALQQAGLKETVSSLAVRQMQLSTVSRSSRRSSKTGFGISAMPDDCRMSCAD